MRFIWPILGLAILTGCSHAKNECGDRFLLLWPTANSDSEGDGNSAYRFEAIQIETLNSPFEMSGPVAQVYYESPLTDQGFAGPVARPHLIESDGVCVPTDAMSALSVSAYAQMERLYRFDQSLAVDTHIPWPRQVGVDISVAGSNQSRHNNAHYFAEGDAIAVVPYTLADLPLSLNHGILAHEHFHAHFQYQVINGLNKLLSTQDSPLSVDHLFYLPLGLKPTIGNLDNADPHSVRGLNGFVVRAWNEGLADLYATVFTGRVNFFADSVAKDVADARILSGPLGVLISGMEFKSESPLTTEDLVNKSYEQGTLLGRLLYRLIDHQPFKTEEKHQFLKRVLTSLKGLPSALGPKFDRQVLDFEAIVPHLLRDFPLTRDICSDLEVAISKNMLDNEFAACSAF